MGYQYNSLTVCLVENYTMTMQHDSLGRRTENVLLIPLMCWLTNFCYSLEEMRASPALIKLTSSRDHQACKHGHSSSFIFIIDLCLVVWSLKWNIWWMGGRFTWEWCVLLLVTPQFFIFCTLCLSRCHQYAGAYNSCMVDCSKFFFMSSALSLYPHAEMGCRN